MNANESGYDSETEREAEWRERANQLRIGRDLELALGLVLRLQQQLLDLEDELGSLFRALGGDSPAPA